MQTLPGMRRPDVVDDDSSRLIADGFVVPDGAPGLVPEPLRREA